MFLLFLIIVFVIIVAIVPRFFKDDNPEDEKFKDDGYGRRRTPKTYEWLRWAIRGAAGAIAFICFLSTSCLIIDSDKVGHLKRIYLGKSMPAGRIIANINEKGPQAKILAPGFHLIPLVRVTHDIEELTVLTIEQGAYGFLVARDGTPMPQGQFIAPGWKNAGDMINAM
jgi:uncharacterized membrane protein YqiK